MHFKGNKITSLNLLFFFFLVGNFERCLGDPLKLNSIEPQNDARNGNTVVFSHPLAVPSLNQIGKYIDDIKTGSKEKERNVETRETSNANNTGKYYYIGGGILLIIIIIVAIILVCYCNSCRKSPSPKVQTSVNHFNAGSQQAAGQQTERPLSTYPMQSYSAPSPTPVLITQPTFNSPTYESVNPPFQSSSQPQPLVLHQQQPATSPENVATTIQPSSSMRTSNIQTFATETRPNNQFTTNSQPNAVQSVDAQSPQIQGVAVLPPPPMTIEVQNTLPSSTLTPQPVAIAVQNQNHDQNYQNTEVGNQRNALSTTYINPQLSNSSMEKDFVHEHQRNNNSSGNESKEMIAQSNKEHQRSMDYDDIKYKMSDIESAMSTIESNLTKLKNLTKDIESGEQRVNGQQETGSHLSKHHSFQQENLSPQNKKSKGRKQQGKEAPASLDMYSSSDYKHMTIKNNDKYKEPYSRDVRHELNRKVDRAKQYESGHEHESIKQTRSTHKSYSNTDNKAGRHESDSEYERNKTRSTHKNTSNKGSPYEGDESNESDYVKQKRSTHKKSSKNEKTKQNKKYKDISSDEEKVPIPEPDYLIENKGNKRSQRRSPSSSDYDKSEKEIPRIPIKPREFKGPYSIEDLDDMNNPLTIALRSRARRPKIGHSDSD